MISLSLGKPASYNILPMILEVFMKYREALRRSKGCPSCCSEALERLSKYIKDVNPEYYVPCSKCNKSKKKENKKSSGVI
jgi:hypothetical protein